MAISKMEELMRKFGDSERVWMVEASMDVSGAAATREEDSMAASHSTSIVDM